MASYLHTVQHFENYYFKCFDTCTHKWLSDYHCQLLCFQGSLHLWDVQKGTLLRALSLGDHDASVFVRQLLVINSSVVVCDFGPQLRVIQFTPVLEKDDWISDCIDNGKILKSWTISCWCNSMLTCIISALRTGRRRRFPSWNQLGRTDFSWAVERLSFSYHIWKSNGIFVCWMH